MGHAHSAPGECALTASPAVAVVRDRRSASRLALYLTAGPVPSGTLVQIVQRASGDCAITSTTGAKCLTLRCRSTEEPRRIPTREVEAEVEAAELHGVGVGEVSHSTVLVVRAEDVVAVVERRVPAVGSRAPRYARRLTSIRPNSSSMQPGSHLDGGPGTA